MFAIVKSRQLIFYYTISSVASINLSAVSIKCMSLCLAKTWCLEINSRIAEAKESFRSRKELLTKRIKKSTIDKK